MPATNLSILLSLCVLCASAVNSFGAEPEVTAKDLPRFPAVEPRDAVKTFKLRPGFAAQLAASEPNVNSPVAIAFDEDARMYVVEMRDYSERRDEHLGRIRLLEDTDGDGVYDKSTVFAENLAWPTAVFPSKGGVFVGCTPDILYLKDTDNDGKADLREVAFTGFGADVKRLNVQALLNSFNWGLDNRIHGAASFNGGKVVRAGPSDKSYPPIDLRGGRGFAFDPISLKIIAENGGGQHGLSFDDWGRQYVCSNSHHIQSFAYDARYADRNKDVIMPPALQDVAIDGPAAEVYRASPEEPWRVIRTKWRVSGQVPGPIEGGGRSAGYFTGATGVTIYRGDAYGKDYSGNAFIGDAGGNLVHRKLLSYPRQAGAERRELRDQSAAPDLSASSPLIPTAHRAPDEQKSEFLANTDTWFRPVQFANAPDGCLHVVDMYRETIEHPWSLPESLKKFLDLNSGWDRGRIWRVVAQNFQRRANPKLSKATTEELVGLLTHPNGWHRDTAARLLYERQDRSAIPHLEKLLTGPAPLGRLHALYTLDGLGALNEADLRTALADPNEHLRAHAVRLTEKLPSLTDATATTLATLADDPFLAVRYQLAWTLGARLNDPQLPELLATIHSKNPADPWLEIAILNSIGPRALDLLRLLDTPARRESSRALAAHLAETIGAHTLGDEVAAVLEIAASQRDPAQMMALAKALGAGLRKAGVTIEAEKGAAILDKANLLATDPTADPALRAAAIAVLGYTTWSHAADTVLPLLDPKQPQDVQLAAVSALDLLDKGQLAAELLSRWPAMSPRLREATAAALVKRPARATALLEAIRDNKVRRTDLSGSQTAALRQSSDNSVKLLAAKVLQAPASKRDDVIKSFQAALDLPPNPAHGRELYLAKCATCHRLVGQGTALGPDLETVRNSGKEKLLTNILDPNREVAPNYTAYIIETTDGDSQIGIIAAETPAGVTLKLAAGAQATLPRSEIKSMRSAGLSMMPEGLEDGWKPQDLADLLDFISTAH